MTLERLLLKTSQINLSRIDLTCFDINSLVFPRKKSNKEKKRRRTVCMCKQCKEIALVINVFGTPEAVRTLLL